MAKTLGNTGAEVKQLSVLVAAVTEGIDRASEGIAALTDTPLPKTEREAVAELANRFDAHTKAWAGVLRQIQVLAGLFGVSAKPGDDQQDTAA